MHYVISDIHGCRAQLLELSDVKKQEIVDYLEKASLYEELECSGKRYVLSHAGIYCFQEDKT